MFGLGLLQGTAMGTPPAPPYANLFYAIYEVVFLALFKDNLILYKRFIDDVVGIWLDNNAEKWNEFKQTMNNQTHEQS